MILAHFKRGARRWLMPALIVAGLAALSACADGGGGGGGKDAPTLNMNYPDSLTGGLNPAALTEQEGGGPNCNFIGTGNDDPFQNGYFMTKWLVSAAATWSCITDFLIFIVALSNIPDDGTVIAIDDPGDPNGPTGVSLTRDSGSQRTIRFYYNGSTTTEGVYLSWNSSGGEVEGRLVLASDIFGDGSDTDAPTDMRMDFSITGALRTADLFLKFSNSNGFNVTGFRIDVTKALEDNSFLALGFLDMSGQPFPGVPATITETPDIRMYTVSNSAGKGAAIAQFTDFGISFDLDPGVPGNHLGDYVFTKADKYFFTATGTSEWIDKTVTAASYDSVGDSNDTDGTTENILKPSSWGFQPALSTYV